MWLTQTRTTESAPAPLAPHATRPRRRGVVALFGLFLLAAANLLYYQWNPAVLLRVSATTDAAQFDAPPQPDGTLPGVPGFSYRLPIQFSPAVFGECFEHVPRTGDALRDAQALSRAIRRIVDHGRGALPSPFVPDEAVRIAAGRKLLCDSYARLLCAALQYRAYVARVLHLKGHVVTEVYDHQRQSWLLVDANLGVTFEDLTGRTLSAAGIIAELRAGRPPRVLPVSDEPASGDPQLTELTSHLRGIFLNGWTYTYDGYGVTYYRKAFWRAGRLAQILQLLKPDGTKLDWSPGGAAALNGLALLAGGWWLMAPRRRPGALVT